MEKEHLYRLFFEQYVGSDIFLRKIYWFSNLDKKNKTLETTAKEYIRQKPLVSVYT